MRGRLNQLIADIVDKRIVEAFRAFGIGQLVTPTFRETKRRAAVLRVARATKPRKPRKVRKNDGETAA